MVMTNPEASRHSRQSQILVPMDTPGVEKLGAMHVFGSDGAPHGHMHLRLTNVRVPKENCLLGPGRGFEISQGRLGPGRIHHCMRLVGQAEKALELLCKRGLPRLVGISKALEWAMSARVFRSEEGLAAGLLRSIHEPEDLLPAAYELAHEFTANSRVSIAVIRQMFWRMLGADDPIVAHCLDTMGMIQLGKSADATEGTTAFLEKRPANFPDKISKDLPDFFPWWDDPKFQEKT